MKVLQWAFEYFKEEDQFSFLSLNVQMALAWYYLHVVDATVAYGSRVDENPTTRCNWQPGKSRNTALREQPAVTTPNGSKACLPCMKYVRQWGARSQIRSKEHALFPDISHTSTS